MAPFGDAAAAAADRGAGARHARRQSHRPAVHRRLRGDIFLYESLHALGLSSAPTSVDRSDGLQLHGVRITNAVKCLPPENKPLPAEIKTCNQYLAAELAKLRSVNAVLALGHGGARRGAGRLGPQTQRREIRPWQRARAARWPPLIDSYHCSRYNTQTRRLTAEMFQTVLKRAATLAGL